MSGEPADFEKILSRELIAAGGERAKLMGGLYTLGTIFGVLVTFFLPQELIRPGVGREALLWVCGFCAAIAAMQVWAWRRIQQVIRREMSPQPWRIWAWVAVECLSTTGLLGALLFILNYPDGLSSPILLVYGAILATTSLGLAPGLSLFAGAVSAGSYLLLAGVATAAGWVEPLTEGSVVTHVARAFYLMLTGGAAAFVAQQLRLRIQHSAEVMKQRNWVVGVFGRYLSSEVVEVLLHDPAGLHLGGSKCTVTLLMTDLRGFSNTSEPMDPQQVVQMLNHYLGAMTTVISRHGGTIDEFIGDAILVIWNAPLAQPDHARRALRCALEMQIEMGAGIHSGDVVVGNIGSAKRQKYGVVGSAVNLTARVESYTVGGEVLITPATAAVVGKGLLVRGEREVYPKGASAALRLLDVVGLDGIRLPPRPSTLREIPGLPVEIRPLEGKDVATVAVAGTLVALSKDEARLCCELPLKEWQNLALKLGEGQAFAKVMALGETALLRFTSLDVRAAAARDAALEP